MEKHKIWPKKNIKKTLGLAELENLREVQDTIVFLRLIHDATHCVLLYNNLMAPVTTKCLSWWTRSTQLNQLNKLVFLGRLFCWYVSLSSLSYFLGLTWSEKSFVVGGPSGIEGERFWKSIHSSHSIRLVSSFEHILVLLWAEVEAEGAEEVDGVLSGVQHLERLTQITRDFYWFSVLNILPFNSSSPSLPRYERIVTEWTREEFRD